MTVTGGWQPRRYPLRITGRLEHGQSRWLWLVKWFLALPHIVVLAFLWLAVLVTTVVAGFAILFTARYPRGLFDFAVGVLRWTWRVTFYAFAPIGTDRYPPFALDLDPTYPADLDVAYPVGLSRGLVLVKWWLLILPQALVVAVLSGGWGPAHFGLISIFALIAIVGYAFTGQYPRPLFDLMMGLQRWCFRVMTYGLLLTDEYPPFRLDADDAAAPPVTVYQPRPLPVQ